MAPETGERDRCLKDPVSYFSGSKQTVMSAEEHRALSVRTANLPSSWYVCPWMLPKSSSLTEPPVTLGSPSPYIAPSGVLSLLPRRPFADLQTFFSIRLFLELLPCTPAAWHTARFDPSPFSPTSQSSPVLDIYLVHPHPL